MVQRTMPLLLLLLAACTVGRPQQAADSQVRTDGAPPRDIAGGRDAARRDTTGPRDLATTNDSRADAAGADALATDGPVADGSVVDGPVADAAPDASVCAPPRTLCPSGCVDTRSDIENCGACNAACATAYGSRTDTCSSSDCICAAHGATPCPANQYCTETGCEDTCPVAQVCGTDCCTIDQDCVIDACCLSARVCGSACCTATQTCIDNSCCPDARVCGASCCTTSQTCIGVTCCPDARVCGSACCTATQTCIDDSCCPEARTCGASCCTLGDTCVGGTTCCDSASVCGTNCCDSGETCLGDTTCCDSASVCGSNCCDSGQTCLGDTACCDSVSVCGTACCDSGEVCLAGPTCGAKPTGATAIYVTTSRFDGNLGGRSGADAKCAAEKPDELTCAILHAFLSVSTSDSIANLATAFNSAQPLYWYNRTTNELTEFAANWTTAITGTLNVTVQDGTEDPFPTIFDTFWTGAENDGSYSTAAQFDYGCRGWTTTSAADTYGGIGLIDATSNWLKQTPYPSCSETMYLLCACKL